MIPDGCLMAPVETADGAMEDITLVPPFVARCVYLTSRGIIMILNLKQPGSVRHADSFLIAI